MIPFGPSIQVLLNLKDLKERGSIEIFCPGLKNLAVALPVVILGCPECFDF